MIVGVQKASRWKQLRLLLLPALVLAVFASGYGLSQVRGSHADPNEVHLCVNSYTGQVRYVQNPAQCTGGFLVTVNQQGVPGPEGPHGPQGPPGPPGGVAGYERVSESVTIPAGHTNYASVADCGEKVVLGGGAALPINPGWLVSESYPISDHEWRVHVAGSPVGFDIVVSAVAICAEAVP